MKTRQEYKQMRIDFMHKHDTKVKFVDIEINNIRSKEHFQKDQGTAIMAYLQCTNEVQQSLLSDEVFSKRLYKDADVDLLCELTPAEIRKLCKDNVNNCGYTTTSDDEFAFLMIEDLEKPTIEELTNLLTSNSDFDELVTLFGEDMFEAVKHIKKADEDILHRMDIKLPTLARVMNERDTPYEVDFSNLRKADRGDVAKLIIGNDKYLRNLYDYIRRSERGVANSYWDATSYPQYFRLAAIVAMCCEAKNVPAYQQSKVKNFMGLMTLHNYNWNALCDIILSLKDENGNVDIEVTKPVKQKTEQKQYIIHGGDNEIFIFTNKKDCDNKYEQLTLMKPDAVYYRGLTTSN